MTWPSSEMRSIGCRNIEVWLPIAIVLGQSSLISSVRVNVISALLVGSGVYIQSCVTTSTPFCLSSLANRDNREHPAIFITYSLICAFCCYFGRGPLSDSCGIACSLTVLAFLANSAFENWPDWRGGDNEPVVVIYIYLVF